MNNKCDLFPSEVLRILFMRATTIDKISEVWFNGEIGGVVILKKLNFMITIMFEIPTLSL